MISLLFTKFAASCTGGNFLFFPHWYKYLDGVTDPTTHACSPALNSVSDIWLIVAAIIEILLRVAGIMAVVFVVYGGFQYVTSQAEPDALMKARRTIINALVGLILAIISATIVNFIAGSVH
jgi:ABC-type Fe3+ transport system permease subunit